MKYRILAVSIACLGYFSSAIASTATASAFGGFDTAQVGQQVTNTNTPMWTWDPITMTPILLPGGNGQTASTSTNFNFRGQQASATATVNGPSLSVASSASTATPPYDLLRATASASFNDQLTFNVQGHTGDTVLVFMRYSITGSGAAAIDNTEQFNNNTYGNSNLNLNLGSGYANSWGNVSPSFGMDGMPAGYTNGYLSPTYQYSPYRIFAAKVGQGNRMNANVVDS